MPASRTMVIVVKSLKHLKTHHNIDIEEQSSHPLLVLLLPIYLTCGAALWNYLEPDWTYSDSLWFMVVEMTTVGFGDISPSTHTNRWINMVFVLLGTCVLATSMSFVFLLLLKFHEKIIK